MGRWLRATTAFFAFLLASISSAWAQGEVGGMQPQRGLSGWLFYVLLIVIMLELIWLLWLEIQRRSK